jgi:hypothetical protein
VAGDHPARTAESGQVCRDMLIGQPVKAVAQQALPGVGAGQGISRRTVGTVVWKAVSKQATWIDAGQCCCGRIDAGEIVRLMAGARGASSAMPAWFAHRYGPAHRILAAVDDTMADAGNLPCMGQYDFVDQSWKQVGVALVRVAELPGFSPDILSLGVWPRPMASTSPESVRSSPA